jgi:serine/threonine protein kinase
MRHGAITPLTGEMLSAGTTALLSAGSIVDSKYKIVGLIGQGGMGAIYKVHHVLLQKEMALKTFRSHGLSQDSWQRFQREAQAIAKLQHKNIVDVFDFGIAEEGLPFYTMELLSGQSLADALSQSGRLAPTDALKIFGQVAQALAHAHRHNIVHRDIKPANVILVADSPSPSSQLQAKLVDFGIAKLAESSPISDDQSLTRAGTVFGSPLYMSPEQSLALPTDHHTDMYSFGCALYETLTGKPPFVGDTALITMLHHQRQSPPTLKDGAFDFAFPQRLEALIAKLLAKKPEDRYQNFDQIIEELDWSYKAIETLRPAASVAQKAYPKPLSEDARQERSDEAVELSPETSGKTKRLIAVAFAIAACFCLIAFALTRTEILKTASNQQTVAKPYFVKLRKDADGNKKVFYFPPDENAGSFIIEESKKTLPCMGEVVVPANEHILLFADAGLCNKPELFRRFGQDDLYGVQLSVEPGCLWSSHHIEEISHIPGLKKLDLSNILELSAQSIEFIGNMKSLKSLDLSETGLKGKDVSRLTNLPRLEQLNVSGINDLSAAWQHMANNNARTEILVANRSNFAISDMPNIGKINNLLYFSATAAGITGEHVRELIPATHMQQLNLNNNNLNDGIIKYLARYKDLKAINLTRGNFTDSGPEQLKQALPAGCVIDYDSKDPKIVVEQHY